MVKKYQRNAFFLLYVFLYARESIHDIFLPVYLTEIGYNNMHIGIIFACGAVIFSVAPVINSLVADKVPLKNTYLAFLIITGAIFVPAYLISNQFIYLVVMVSLAIFFSASALSVTDSITLELANSGECRYGRIQTGASLGYFLTGIIAGIFASQKGVGITFVIFGLVSVFAMFSELFLPKMYNKHISSSQDTKEKLPLREFFKSRELIWVLLLGLAISIGLQFYDIFFPSYLKSLGMNSLIISITMGTTILSELLLLLVIDRISKKYSPTQLLTAAAVLSVFRWGTQYFVTDIFIIIGLQLLNGLIYILTCYSLAMFISNHLPRKFSSLGQGIALTVRRGIAMIIASLAGGTISNSIGTGRVFLYISFMLSGLLVIWGLANIPGTIKRISGVKNDVKSETPGDINEDEDLRQNIVAGTKVYIRNELFDKNMFHVVRSIEKNIITLELLNEFQSKNIPSGTQIKLQVLCPDREYLINGTISEIIDEEAGSGRVVIHFKEFKSVINQRSERRYNTRLYCELEIVHGYKTMWALASIRNISSRGCEISILSKYQQPCIYDEVKVAAMVFDNQELTFYGKVINRYSSSDISKYGLIISKIDHENSRLLAKLIYTYENEFMSMFWHLIRSR